MSLPQAITFLQNPQVYDHPVDRVELVQTHISYVLLAGDFVYKVKKPVDFGFLDFTTLAKRKHYCEQELVLNRRLCPDLYLELMTVSREGESLQLNGPGEPVEFAVKMARMPAAGMMAPMIAAGALTKRHLDRIVATLIPFYQAAAGGPEIAAFGRAQAVAVNVLENFEQTSGFIGCAALSQQQFDTITAAAKRFLAREELFEQRLAAGRIRDCHGDLYSANICFSDDRVYIFDCIEFNERFRYCDMASDIAFLAMDLDYHNLPAFAEYFVQRLVTAAADPELEGMLPFYKGYRAYVRGKIGLFTAHDDQVDPKVRQQCLEDAGRYFALAERYARQIA